MVRDELSVLSAFLAVAEERSFTRAAKRIGVTQFIISGWPKLDEMVIFGREVLPLVRDAEQRWESP